MLTVEDIENITFRKAGLGGGYKIDDVDGFVDKVIDRVKELELENKELRARIEVQDKEILSHKEKEESVQNAIISAEMTAKQIVMDATMKSESRLSESKETGEKLVREAHEKADKLVRDAEQRAREIKAETDAKVEEVMNKALRESFIQIEENNQILEQQKKNIIRLMGEANKFRNSLLQTYKEHLKVINSMAKADDLKKQSREMDEKYPPVHGNAPVTLSEPAKAETVSEEGEEDSDSHLRDISSDSSADIVNEPEAAEKAVEETFDVSAEIENADLADAEPENVSDESSDAEPEEEQSDKTEDLEDLDSDISENVGFISKALNCADEADEPSVQVDDEPAKDEDSSEQEDVPEEPVVRNNRQPIVFETSQPETVSGMLKLDDTAPKQPVRSKKNKHKKRR